MTRAQLRSDLAAFKSMVRSRGPGECMAVAAKRPSEGSMTHYERFLFRELQMFFSRAVLRWWRWATKQQQMRHQRSVIVWDYYSQTMDWQSK